MDFFFHKDDFHRRRCWAVSSKSAGRIRRLVMRRIAAVAL
jgi:hypothetical protein